MQGGQNRQPLGYTIVEVLIVLAVSSFMFVIAANFINGKQARTAFTQGSNDVASNLQSVLDQVTDGHFSDVPITCTNTGSTLTIINNPSPSQGTNQDCVFLGKLLHFYAAGGSDRNDYEVYSLAAARDSKNPVGSNTLIQNVSQLTTQGAVSQNLFVQTMDVVDTAGSHHHNAFNIGFAQGLGTADALAPDTYKSGAQNVNLIYFSGAWGVNGVGSTYIQPAKSATICVTDSNRSADVFIGGTSNNSNELSIRVKQLGAVTCP
jgi:type II secretory pathway pseudopilin PulG